jgi:hypothetical protein
MARSIQAVDETRFSSAARFTKLGALTLPAGYQIPDPLPWATIAGALAAATSRAAQNLVGELGLREATWRRRFRAWGIF